MFLPDSRSCIPAAVRAELHKLDVGQSSPSRKGVPPLGLATLTAYLRERGIDTTAYDFRTDVTGMGSDRIPQLSQTMRWVSEAVTLELLVPILDRYFAGCDVDALLRIDRGAEYYRRFADERGMFLSGLMASIDELHELVNANLSTWSTHDLIGFSTYQDNMYAVMLACMALRRQDPKQKLIVGGPEVTQSHNSAKLMLYTGLVDAVVPGEALGSTLGVIRACADKTPLTDVPGILTLDGAGELVRTIDAPIQAMDEVPFPDFTDYSPDEYFPFTYPLGTSRGCPFRCNFCSEKDMFGGGFRRMSLGVAYETVHRAVDSLRCQKVFFCDSMVNTSEKWLQSLAEKMVEDKLGISWQAYMRATTNRKLLSVLRESGLSGALIGIESISDELLATMVKRQTKAENIGSINAFLDEGIPISPSFIIGYPGETEREHNDLVELMWKMSERNLEVQTSAKNNYVRTGFESPPQQTYAEACCLPRPFYLKPMNEIFDTPKEFSLSVSPYGGKFAQYKSLPERVQRLIASTPYTFGSEQISTAEVWRRMGRFESVPHLQGALTAFGQRVHTMYHGLRDDDRFTINRASAFDADGNGSATGTGNGVHGASNGGDGALTYRSSALELDIACPDLSPRTVEHVERGGTLRELTDSCTAGNESAKIRLKHMLAMAAVEDSLEVTFSLSRPTTLHTRS